MLRNETLIGPTIPVALAGPYLRGATGRDVDEHA